MMNKSKQDFDEISFGNGGYSKSSININLSLNLFLVITLLLILIIIPGVLSLGITPGRTTLNYESSVTEKEIVFSVLNNEHKSMQVMLVVQGELNNSIALYENSIKFDSSEESKQLKYKFVVPEGIEKNPGLHTADIIALEVPERGSSGTYVGATVAVATQLYFYVPYPGKYVEADLNVLDAESNGTATFIVPVINRGKLGIGEVRAVIDVYDSMNQKIDTINTDYYPLEPGKRTELSAKWNVSVPTANYLAKFSVFYDGESKNFQKQFAVGIKGLSIGSILVNDFRLGEIAKLQILVENRWNEELKNVFANLLVYDKDYQIMADVKSASENIPALTQKELIAYWDTIGVEEGEYSGKLMVRYGEKSSDKNLILKIKQNSLDFIGVGYAINPEGRNKISITTILIMLIILLIIVNISWLVFFMIKRRGNEK